jgi:hypothetical protein
LPIWLKKPHIERGLLQTICSFIQAGLSAGVALYAKCIIDLCTENCQITNALQIGLEAGIDLISFTFSIFCLEFEFPIDLGIALPVFEFCVPFPIDLCKYLVKGDGKYIYIHSGET